MKNPIFVSVLLMLLFALNIQAQDKLSWRKHVKLADELYTKAQYADAGEHYRAAWKQKTKEKDLIHKAGECFNIIRDYRNAADCWKNVKDDNAKYPLIGLRYARALKQNGEYENASSELVNFLGNYQGADKQTVANIVQSELRGCELAAQLAAKGDNADLVVSHLGSNINTPLTEFAPFPWEDEALYFSSTMAKRAEIYRSVKSNGEWQKATPLPNFPVNETDHFCNGSLTPDAQRFYFTICKSVESWGGLTTQCEVFVTRKVNSAWAPAEKLPDYINEAGVTTTHPFVVHEGGTEILYFATNRKGGMGGMDVWYTTRELNSTANDFTLPINCGSKINTLGDEITPFYDKLDKQLYFATNGHASIGGKDIFRASGARSQWEKPENAGTPLNSAADDFSFVKTSSGKGGFFVSNRTFGMEKVTTTHEDIFAFEFTKPARQWVAKGEVLDKNNREPVADVEIALYEVKDNGQRRFLDKIVSTTGSYEFPVEPSAKYYLEAIKKGYFPGSNNFDTYDFEKFNDFGVPVMLEQEARTESGEPLAVEQKVNEAPSKVGVKEKETAAPAKPKLVIKNEPEAKPAPAKVKTEVPAAAAPATRQEGTTYKIQIIAIGKFDANQARYAKVKNMARLDTEFLAERNLYRVLLADYDNLADAKADMAEVKTVKDFETAFIVEYRNGERVGKVEEQ